MDRSYVSGASATPPAAPVSPSIGYPTPGNPATSTPATKQGAWWYHMITESMVRVIEAAGLTPAHNNLDLFKNALQTMFARLGIANTWTKAQRGSYVALTSTAGSIAVNLADSNNFTHTFTENTVLAAPSGVVAGQSGVIEFVQHASVARTLGYNAFWKFADGIVPAISSTLSAKQKFFYVVDQDGLAATCVLMNPRS